MMHTWILLLVGVLCNTLLFSSPVSAQGTSSSPASPTTELTVNSTTPYPTPQTPQNIIACESNDQCLNGNLCINNLCMDACHPGHCVKNVNCQAGGHRPSCICIPGTTDNLKVKCIALSSGTFMSQPPGQPPFIIPDSLIIPESEPPRRRPQPYGEINPHNDSHIIPGRITPTQRPPLIALKYHTIREWWTQIIDPIPTPPSITIGCENNDECSTDNSCINKLCIDACSLGYCGENADCQTSHHRPVCICPPGTTGDPAIGCRALVQLWSVDSPPLPVTAPIGCENHDECSADNNCINKLCIDACLPGLCGEDADCQTSDHRPVCVCPPGTTGNPTIKCSPLLGPYRPLPTQPPITGQPPNHLDSLIIPEAGPPPRMVPPLSELPTQTYPRTTPTPRPPFLPIPPLPIGCRNNDDCSTDNSCINKLCVDACNPGVCGGNTDCKTIRHRPICVCPPGTTGDPLIGCNLLLTEHVERSTSLLTTPCYCL